MLSPTPAFVFDKFCFNGICDNEVCIIHVVLFVPINENIWRTVLDRHVEDVSTNFDNAPCFLIYCAQDPSIFVHEKMTMKFFGARTISCIRQFNYINVLVLLCADKRIALEHSSALFIYVSMKKATRDGSVIEESALRSIYS